MMKRVDDSLLQALSADAARAARRRTNHNLHQAPDDRVQRFCNAMAPGSYVRPHRHVTPPKWELFALLRGAVAVLTFDTDGARVGERVELRTGGDAIVEIPAGVWHTLVVLEPDTVLLEVKEGPYQPLSDKDFAAWAPAEGDEGAAPMERWFRTARPGDMPPA